MARGRLFFLIGILILLVSCKTELYSGLTEKEANEIVAVLRSNNISADRSMGQGETVSILIEESSFEMAMEILEAEGLPRESYRNLGDVFKGNGFVVSKTEERARFIFAMSEELSRTISEIDGVLSARTHVVLPASDPLSRDTTPSSASVVIRHSADMPTEALLPQIKMLVANSIEGLEYDQVSAVFIPVQKQSNSPQAIVTDMTPIIPPWVWGLIGLAAISSLIAIWALRRPTRSGQDFVIERSD